MFRPRRSSPKLRGTFRLPTSDMRSAAAVMAAVLKIKPQSVLDLGIGFGKYGVLMREWTDGVAGRVACKTWQTSIIGVEAHEPYRNPAWDLYDRVGIEDFTDIRHWFRYTRFDLVLLIDSLEHVSKTIGDELLMYLIEHNRHVIVATPNGYRPQTDVNGNEFERHRSGWTVTDLQRPGARFLLQGHNLVAHFTS